MAGFKKKRRKQMVAIGAVMLTLAAGLIIYAGRDAFEFFRSPSDIATEPPRAGERFRLGGLVKEASWEQDGETHRFVITDTANDFPVRYTGILPDLFREGQGIIARGKMTPEGTFVAEEVLAKHDENYMPPEVADSLKPHADAANAMGQGST